MHWLRRLAWRLEILFCKGRAEAELDEEIRCHLEQEREAWVRRGMSPEEARQKAAVDFGGVEQVKEQVRDVRGARLLDEFIQDLRYACSTLRKQRLFSALAMATLGIGVGAVSLMFSIYNTVVLRPLPFKEPDRLIWVWSMSERLPENSMSYSDYVDYRGATEAFESMAAFTVFSRTRILTGGEEAEQVISSYVSGNLFSTLGIAPAFGRPFLPGEEATGQDEVVILSHGLWQRKYGGDPEAIGSNITLDGQTAEIVGVMPAGFDFPAGVDLWFPLQREAGYASGRDNNNFLVVGRLREGASIGQAKAQMDVVARQIADAYPDEKAGWWVKLVPIHERFFGSIRASLLMLSGILVLVPLVACSNAASLFMARATTRRTELAARLALGASRPRVIRQLLTESLVVAMGGGVVGLALAYQGGESLRFLAPAALPRLSAISIDGRVLACTLTASLVMIPLFGIIPALRGTGMQIAETLKAGGGPGSSHRRPAFRSAMVVVQVALSLMLMLASGLLLRSFLKLQSVDPGFKIESLLCSRLTLPRSKYGTPERIEQFWDDVRQRLTDVPGVLAVGAIDRPPISGEGPMDTIYAAERPPASAAEKVPGMRRFATEGYFDALQIRLLAGRVFNAADGRGTNTVTVINETLARQFFPGQNPRGRTLVLEWDPAVNLEVIGTVADVRELGPGRTPPATFYLPARWNPRLNMHLLVRTQGDPLKLAGALRQVIGEVDSDVPVSAVQTMESRLSDSLFQTKFRSTLVGLFSLVALILSSIGLYGVLACYVRQRRREISIRVALGADTGNIARLVLRQGMTIVAVGVLLGFLGGLAGARWIESALYGIRSVDPATYLGAGLSLIVVSLVACLNPALQAARVDPALVVKGE